jgi:hypothetical protein
MSKSTRKMKEKPPRFFNGLLGCQPMRFHHPATPGMKAFFAAVSLLFPAFSARAQVVINEIYYDPPDNTTPTEFLELFNTGTAALDLSGWKTDSGVTFDFPGGSTIPAGGYLVLAQDAAAFQTAFGFAPFGVYVGKLSNQGEKVCLRNSLNATVDEVTYGEGFPWPTASRGLGSSMELIHPTLDNTLPGSWRASGQPAAQGGETVFVPPVSTTWH